MSRPTGRDAGRTSEDSLPVAIDSPTSELLHRIRQGDSAATELLYRRYLPRFQRWARHRVPHALRGAMETGDLVQEALTRSLKHVDKFESRRPGAFLDYIRTIARNRIVEEVRRNVRRPATGLSSVGAVDPRPTPLETVLGREALDRYEGALSRLPTIDRAAVTARMELGLSFREVAAELELPSADAARVRVGRAVRRLAEEMARDG